MLPLSYFELKRASLLSVLTELVQKESPSLDKAAVDVLGGWLKGQLEAMDARVRVLPVATAGNHLAAHWGDGTRSKEDGILLLCHMDTVYPLDTLARQPCRIDGDRITGPGVVDMKASIAIALVAIEALRAEGGMPGRAVTLLITSDEEVGSDTSRALIEATARDHALVLCMEPALPDGSLKTWRKGVGDFMLTARGRASHAGADHEKGVNAIEAMARHVLTLQALTDYAHGTTVNVGVIKGGTRSNVVPDACTAHVDYRVMTPEEAERVESAVRALRPSPGTELEITGGLNRPPMPHTPLMAQTFAKAKAIGERLGLTLGEGGTGGGSDANFVAPLEVPVLDGLGAVGNGAHSEREHVFIPSLPQRAALLAALLTEW